MPQATRPTVIHQSGAKQIDALRANYEAAGVQAELTPFIDDTASAFCASRSGHLPRWRQHRDRVGRGGVAAVFVPFPFAVDDHQTTNAQSWWPRVAAGWCRRPS